MRFLLLTLTLAVFISCKKEIEIQQPAYQSQVVVDGWIEAGDYAYVLLTKSSPYLTKYDSASIRNTFLNYAKVTLTSSKGESEVLILSRRDEFFPPFVYRSLSMKGEVNTIYELKIEVEGLQIKSETKIPNMPDVKRVLSISNSDTTIQIDAQINDEEGVENYYFTQIRKKNYDTKYHPSSLPLYNDKGQDGQVINLRVLNSKQPDPLNLNDLQTPKALPTYQFYYSDTVFLKISSISKSSFLVLNDILLDQRNNVSPFSFNNKETSTNIIGGIGRWTGMATKNYVVFNQ